MPQKNKPIIALHSKKSRQKCQQSFLKKALDETVSLRIEIANIYAVLETLCASDDNLTAFLKITDRLENSSLKLNIIFKALENMQRLLNE